MEGTLAEVEVGKWGIISQGGDQEPDIVFVYIRDVSPLEGT